MTSLYYDLAPKDPRENLLWRIRCRERALTDLKFRDALWQACMSDVCFWMGFAMYGYDPRSKNKIVPFIPFTHQEYVFCKLDEAFEYTQDGQTLDVLVDKARAQGGTFGYLWVDLRRWLRDPMFSAGYVTRNADLVDSKTDSDTVLWKVQFAINMLPAWMRPRYERNLSQHTFENKDNGALLKGYSAGQDVAAGGRASVFTCLEAGTRVVTDRGIVRIEEVHLKDRVWDGIRWVSHGGCVYRGERKTISSYGIRLTPDHRVFTTKGWKHASEGFDRAEIRLPYCLASRRKSLSIDWEEGERYLDVPVRLRRNTGCRLKRSAKQKHQKLWMLSEASNRRQSSQSREIQYANVSCLAPDGSAMHGPKMQRLSILWRARRYCRQRMAQLRVFHKGHGRSPRRNDIREERKQQGVLQRKLQMGDSPRAGEQHAKQSCSPYVAWKSNDCGTSTGDGLELQLHQEPHPARLVGGRSSASTQNPKPVYDLLNCGVRRAFTVIDNRGRPLLVHNCDEFGSKDFVSGGKDFSVMEALHDVTGYLRLVSARYVDQGVFHEACEAGGTEGGWHLILDWKDHPVHSKHSYVVMDNVPTACKPEDAEAVAEYHKSKPNLRDLLEKKGFKYEGVVRSPWYNMRCLRKTARPQLIASQLDRNPKGAVGKVFTHDLLERMKKMNCKQPVWKGNPVFDSETLEIKGLIARDDGALTLWFRPGIDDSPPLGPYTVACDIASGGVGVFASNSIASGIDDRTGEQVLEYVVKGLEPRPFARIVVGLCLWLRKAKLGWEDSGVSGGFAKEVMEVLYYGNIYFRNVMQLGTQKKSRKPGFPCRDVDKADMFEQFALAMEKGLYTPRSSEMVVELGEYEWDGGKIIHAPTKNKGASDKNHGDRAIAAAGAWLVYSADNIREKVDSDEEKDKNPEYGSFLWREMQERHSANSGSPSYGIRDVLR